MLRLFNKKLVVLVIAAFIVVAVLYVTLEPFIYHHFLHGDERYYIGRALQDIEFYTGVRSARAVWFSSGNHPFSAETIIGLSIFLQGKFREAPSNPWKTSIDRDLLVAARRSALIVGLLGLGACFLLALYLDPWLAPMPILYLLASPGFVDFSMRCMLDIYLASFVTLALVCMVLYMLIRSRRWMLASGLFIGLALGSKTGWDSLVAFFVCSIAILITEEGFRSFVKRQLLYILASFASFSSTSTVIILRLPDHINSVLAHHASRIEISNIFTGQPLVANSFNEMTKLNYNIFSYQHPTCMLITGISVAMFISFLLLTLPRCKSLRELTRGLKNDGLLKASILVVAFTALTLLLTSMTFEYGRNYARLTLYDCLITTLCLAYLLKVRKLIVKLPFILTITLFLVLALHSYWCNVLGTCYYGDKGYFFKTGKVLVSPQLWMAGEEPMAYLISSMKFLNLIPWASWLLLLLSLVSLVFFAFMGVVLGARYASIAVDEIAKLARSTYSRSNSLLTRISKRGAALTHIIASAETEKQVEAEESLGIEAGEAHREEVKPLKEAPRPSLSHIVHILIEELAETPTDEMLTEAFAKLAEAYGELKNLRSLTLREALTSIAKEQGLDINEVLEVARAVEGYIYGGKPLTPRAREVAIQILRELI
ncbi:hypothetical protein DRP04_04190 [Archaeoglobales archaeon]|nr:MAG: hypothetical protein DRP04_04190 [Archaeoglobales archaeon]